VQAQIQTIDISAARGERWPAALRALQAGTATTGILYTSSRAFPRSRKNPGLLIQAIHAWMLNGPPEAPLTEDWLLNQASR
jgi:hypothetical protein